MIVDLNWPRHAQPKPEWPTESDKEWLIRRLRYALVQEFGKRDPVDNADVRHQERILKDAADMLHAMEQRRQR